MNENERITSCQAGKVCQLSAGKTQVSKATGPKRACTALPVLPMRMRLVLFGRARHSMRAVFSIAIHDSRENTATAFRLAPTISVRLCLITRIDRGELRLNHFLDKLAKSSCGLPANFLRILSAQPTSRAGSAGRSNAGLCFTYSCHRRSTIAKAASTNSRTECDSPVASTT